MFRDYYSNTMIAGALALCVAKASASVVLALQDKRVFFFQKGDSNQVQLPS